MHGVLEHETRHQLGAIRCGLQVQYTTDLQSFWTAAVVLLALCMVVVVLSCCLRIFNWCGRNTRSRAEQVLTLGVLVRAGVYFAGNFGRVIFWCELRLCCATLYLWTGMSKPLL